MVREDLQLVPAGIYASAKHCEALNRFSGNREISRVAIVAVWMGKKGVEPSPTPHNRERCECCSSALQ